MSSIDLAPGMGFRITASEIPNIVTEFFSSVDAPAIDKLVQRYMASLKENPILSVSLTGKRFVIGLEIAIDIYFGRGSGNADLFGFPDVVFFMKMYRMLCNRSGDPERRILDGRLRDSLNPDRDFREFSCELYVAFAYASYGCSVSLVDMDEKVKGLTSLMSFPVTINFE